MSKRTINLEQYRCSCPHQPLLDWIRANGLDPHSVPIAQEVIVVQNDPVTEDSISLTLFSFDVDGHKLLDSSGDEPLWNEVTVPLISAPENHGL